MTPPRDWDAGTYDRVGAPMTARGIELVDGLELRGDETALDAGCGTGRVTARLLERLPAGHVIALDGSQAMLDVAAERFGGDPRVTLLRADLEAPLPLAEPVDLIVSTSTLHWVRDHDALWPHLRAALRTGGVLAAEFGGAGNIARVLEHAEAAGAHDQQVTFAGAEETRRRLEAAGFTVVTAELRERPATVPREELHDYLRTVVLGVHVDRLGPERGEQLVAEVARRMREPVIDYVRLVVHAIAA